MSRSNRMFEIIQLLRNARQPVTAATLADALEVTPRTVYRDIAALQGMRVPIEGEAGIGYVMRRGFDLPPLMFTTEEVEAIAVGLALIRRTGDSGLEDAATRAAAKIADVLPEDPATSLDRAPLYVSDWTAIPAAEVDLRLLRSAIRNEVKLSIAYRDDKARETSRTVRPLAVIYYIDAVVLAAWCELRDDFRHFRVDRIVVCAPSGETFAGEGDRLRQEWSRLHQPP